MDLRQQVVARLMAAGCVFASDEAELLLAEHDGEQLEQAVVRRVQGEPLEQVLGWAQFAGLRVRVAPGVFVPRRRSELLAREALAVVADGDVVVELCCGAAAISLAVLERRALELYAADVDPRAVAVAADNLGPRGTALCGDLYMPLPHDLRGRVRLIVANAPYVPSAEIDTMPTEARDHEPHVALDGGSDGTRVQRAVIAQAPEWLAPEGVLIVETSRAQAPLIAQAMRERGLLPRVCTDDELDGTCVIGCGISHM